MTTKNIKTWQRDVNSETMLISEWYDKTLGEIPEMYRQSATFCIEGDDEGVTIEISYERPETEEEAAERIATERAIEKWNQERKEELLLPWRLMPSEVAKSLKNVLNHHTHKEADDFTMHPTEDHIYRDIYAFSKWLGCTVREGAPNPDGFNQTVEESAQGIVACRGH
jgi:hypothetical protein